MTYERLKLSFYKDQTAIERNQSSSYRFRIIPVHKFTGRAGLPDFATYRDGFQFGGAKRTTFQNILSRTGAALRATQKIVPTDTA